ncbi:TauD/TfdA family dioxygenase [Phenylobacterium sp.]|uniref:TauD/TfdA family dioxygenase n=1 Tax=Phenylobacterium sp. TaxID=1871053 RepID=UPI0035B18682
MTGSWLKVLDGSALAEDAVEDVIRKGMAEAKVLRIVGMKPKGDPLAFWGEKGKVTGAPAVVLESSDGAIIPADAGWMDVRFEPDRPDTYRHANVGQPMHTDGAYSDDGQDIGLFFLERQAESGGESLMIDAETIAERLSKTDPDLLERLFSTTVRFGKGEAGRIAPILVRQGERLKIHWNWFRVLPGQGEAVDKLREDFRAALEDMVEDGTVAAFRLQPGDAVFFRDDEVLHGRKAYAAKVSGDRLLWKTYFVSDPARARTHAA